MSEDVKFYLKQIEDECMEMADRLKLDAHRRNGLEDKFKKAYGILEMPVLRPTPIGAFGSGAKVEVEPKPIKRFR